MGWLETANRLLRTRTMKKTLIISLLAASVVVVGVAAIAAVDAGASLIPGSADAQPEKRRSDATLASQPITADDANCSTCDGFRLMNSGQYAQAMDIFQRRARVGDSAAMDNIAWMYRYGLGVPADPGKSFEWYLKAANLNDSVAQMNLGHAYETGQGAATDASSALKYYRLSAENGNLSGIVDLGMMYQHGTGVPVDYDRAMKLYRQAAFKGEATAMNQIGYMFQHGLGVKVDLDTAYCWYSWSSDQDNDRAKVHIAEIQAQGRAPPSSCEVLNDTGS
jgi:hypothetical protein